MPSDTPAAVRRRPRRLRTALLIGLTLAVGAGWWFNRNRNPAGPAESALSGPGASQPGGTGTPGGRRAPAGGRAQPVSAGTVERRDIRVIQPAIGNIAALNTAVVRARVDGELRAIRFTEGQQVRAGDVLAEIDPSTYQVQLAQAEGQLARDQAQLNNAQIDLARYRDLASRDSIARQQVDTQEALVNQLKGTLRIDQAAVDNARLQLSYTRVTAPISGQVGLRQLDLGNIVRAGDTTGIVVITQTQPISVVFSIPESALPRLRVRMRSGDKPMVEAWDRELRQRLAVGAVSSTDNAIDPATGTIKIKAQFDNRDGALFPNQFVNIRLHVETVNGALAIPLAAVQRGSAGNFVYVIKDDGSVSVRTVTPDITDGDWTSVRGELSPGDKVVTDGADRLREGARVEAITPGRAPGAGRPSGGPPGGGAPPAGGPASAPGTGARDPGGSGSGGRPPRAGG